MASSRTDVPASRALRSIGALILREMSSSYGRSAGGYIWAVIEPAGTILFFTFIISAGLKLRTPALGESFAFFYATGVFPFMTYARVANKVAQALNFSAPLLRYPAVAWIDAILARYVLQMLTQVMAFSLVIIGILLANGLRFHFDYAAILLALAMTGSLSFGIGVLMAYVFPKFPLIETLWSILTAPLFLLSGVILIYDDLPRSGQDILWWNPLVHLVGQMRKGFYPYYEAHYVSPLYVFLIAALCAFFGLLLLRRNYLDTITL